jgi:hypothetical protein
LGQGSNGSAGVKSGSCCTQQGGGGSCGANGTTRLYGGGGRGFMSTQARDAGGQGAVRIIWPGTTRSFPSTCTGNL